MAAYLPLQVASKASSALVLQLEQRFLRLTQKIQLPTSLQTAYWQETQQHYEQEQRPYHNLVHLHNFLYLMDLDEVTVADPVAFELAIWYHDLIYDVAQSDNEVRSAARLVELWQDHLPAIQLARAEAHILATAGHQLRTDDPDEPLFLDLDLSILATAPTTYQQYSQAIAQEYGTLYPLPLYQLGRSQVLQNFLQRDALFFTPLFQEVYEATARANLREELEGLQVG